MTVDGRLRLRAEDEQDLGVLAAMLQDAIVPLADMLYLPEERRFAMVVNRFMWEAPAEAVTDESGPVEDAWWRVHGLVSVQHVDRVQVRGIDQTERDRLLCLLSMRPVDGCIHFDFAGGGTIRIEVTRIDCLLEDLGDPWPTRWRPCHPEEDASSA